MMSALASLSNVISVLLFLTNICTVEPACGPVEEGQPTNLTCNVNTAGCNPSVPVLDWKVQTIPPAEVEVILCFTDACGGRYSPNFISATISSTSSTLTINSVSRTVPFNMETKWTCHPCSPRPAVTVCDKLQVYAKPISPSCTVTENPESGEIMSVTVTCSTDKVYPAAKCHFDKIKNGGQPVRITQTIDYETPTPTSTTPVYYNSECSVTVSVQELGEGSHDFLGFIYPDVTDGHSLVDGISPDKTVTLSFPQASHNCTTKTVQGYFIGKSAMCICTITSDGNPRGTAQWYRGDNPVGTAGTTATEDVPYDKNNAEQTYTCEAKSNLGRKAGSTLKAKFAFLDRDSVQVEPPLSPIKLCDDNTKTAQVTCRISKENVSPAALTFSFSRDGLTFEDSKPGNESSDGIYYQREFSFSQDVGGEYLVYCRVVNTILNTNERGDTRVIFQKPPSGPAQVTVDGQSYQGTAQSNIVTLIEGYTGDVTCRVEGGYPSVTNTHLKCGQREITGDRNTATLGFTDNPLRRDWNGKECSCTSQHVSGCYSNRDTKLTLNVLYPPNVTFSKDPTATIFNKGGRVVLTCSAQGNPDPSLTLTTESTNGTVILANVQTSTLTHTLNSLDCLDTGVYVCSGQNSRGTNPKDISINVRCPQQLSPTFDPPPIIDAVMDDTAEIDVDIYGFPEPSSLYLEKTIDKTNLTSSPRHTVKYTARDAPFGVVTVTIFDIVEADYTNYTLTVDNGVGETLIYNFYLNEVIIWTPSTTSDPVNATPTTVGPETQPQSEGGTDSGVVIGVVVGVLVLVILVVVVAVVMLYRRGKLPGQKKPKDRGPSGKLPVDLKEEEFETVNAVYNMEDNATGWNGGVHYRQSDYVEKKNPVYASGNEFPGNGMNLRESDYVEKNNPVYASSKEMPGNGVDLRDDDDYVEKINPVYAGDWRGLGQRVPSMGSKDYRHIESIMTSASAAPSNYSKSDPNTYEDIGNVEKTRPSTAPKPKPKPSVAPKTSYGNAGAAPGSPPSYQVEHTGPVEEPYAMISHVNKARKHESATTKQDDGDDDFMLDPSTKPDVPDKQFADGDPYARVNDIPEQLFGNCSASDTNARVDTPVDEESVYANTSPAGTAGDSADNDTSSNDNTNDGGNDDGRYRNEEGLIYTSVEFGSAEGNAERGTSDEDGNAPWPRRGTVRILEDHTDYASIQV